MAMTFVKPHIKFSPAFFFVFLELNFNLCIEFSMEKLAVMEFAIEMRGNWCK